jgi:hypothetical protein
MQLMIFAFVVDFLKRTLFPYLSDTLVAWVTKATLEESPF